MVKSLFKCYFKNFTKDFFKKGYLKNLNKDFFKKDYFKDLNKDFKGKVPFFFHMNVCSLTKNFDDLNILLSELNVSFDILAITKSQIKEELSNPINCELNNYLIEYSPTESSADGTFLSVTYQERYSHWYTSMGARILVPKKGNICFFKLICSAKGYVSSF